MSTTGQTQVAIVDLLTITKRALKDRALQFAAASVLILALAIPLSAQTFRGTILGTVTDPAGDGSAGSCRPGTQHFGNLGRNSLIGPAYSNLDFSIFKTTPITEQVKVELRVEIFNIFNHPNLSAPLLPGFSADASFNGINPVTGLGQGFLRITVTPDVGIGNPFLGGGGSRNIQFALRLLF